MTAAPASGPSRGEKLMATVLVVALAVAACIVRWPTTYGDYGQPDERIAESVVGRTLAEGTLDTNWARSGVDTDLRYNEYNFSSYFLTAAAVELDAGHGAQDADKSVLRRHLRHLSCLLASAAIVLAGLLGWRLAAAPEAAVVAALLTAVNVALFQDAIYARPEAFLTTASLLYVLLMASRRLAPMPMLATTALLGGFLLAAKISFALFLPFPPLIAAARLLRERSPQPIDLRRLAGGFAVFAICTALGFFIGAPYAVLAPHEYIEGVRGLLQFYAAGFGPHGLPQGDLAARFGYGVAYLSYTQGPLLPALAVFGYATLIWPRRRVVPALALLGPLLTLAYFLQTHAFIERNFSHALPAAFALVGCAVSSLARAFARWMIGGSAPSRRSGLATTIGVAAGLLLSLPSLSVSRKLFDLITGAIDYPRLLDAEQQRVTSGGKLELVFVWYSQSIIEKPRDPQCRKQIYRVLDYGDPGTRANVQAALAHGFRQVGSVHSPFHGSPTSTLWVYHAADWEFLETPDAGADGACVGPAAR